MATAILALTPGLALASDAVGFALQESAAVDPASAPIDSLSAAPSESTSKEASDTGSTSIPDELAPSTGRPWVPERAVPAAESWETALRMPGRILTLPLSGLGYVTQHTLLTIEQTNFVNRVLVTIEPIPRAGLRIMPASLGERTGFGLGIAYSPPVVRRHLIARWDGSMMKYSRTSVDAAYGPARLGYRYDWRPRERFYGVGPESERGELSTYGAQSQSVRLGFEYQRTRDREPDSPRWGVAAWLGPRELITRHGRGTPDPSFEERFPSLLPFLDQRVEHLVYGGRLSLDHRRGKPHWAEGGRTSVEVERFDKPIESIALRTSQTPFRYTRWTYDAEGGISFLRDPRTLRLELRVVDTVPDASSRVLLSDMATLGGGQGLWGFDPGRFQDLDSVLGRLSYIFPLSSRFEFDLHTEVGQVVHELGEVGISALRQSYGIALRPRLDDFVLGMIGVDWSDEGVRIRFSVGGVD